MAATRAVELWLNAEDEAKLAGDHGPGVAMAMRLVVALAKVSQATQLIDIESAHIDGCLYHGQAGLDFIAIEPRQFRLGFGYLNGSQGASYAAAFADNLNFSCVVEIA